MPAATDAASRQQICQQTSRKLADAVSRLPSLKATVGLDGFVDEIIAVVDKRHDGGRYDPVRTIAHLAQKINDASGQSSNYELVVKQRKLGGNGPIMANALACATPAAPVNAIARADRSQYRITLPGLP